MNLVRKPLREFRTAQMDGHRWDPFVPRDGDIVTATYPKCGTTWMQRIVDLLVFQSPEPRRFFDASPWLDRTAIGPIDDVLKRLEGQTHRRFIKTHMPFDALPVWDGVKYIHVARDGRDACLSHHNHLIGTRPEVRAAAAGETQSDPRIRRNPEPTADPRAFYQQWIALAEADDGLEYGVSTPFFEFETSYWNERQRGNLLFVHYDDLKVDLAGEMRRISDFLGIDTPEGLMPSLAAAARFETMKSQGNELMPHMWRHFDRGADRFINEGRSGRWKEVLTPEDSQRYEALMRRKATPSLAAWIEKGRLGAGDPPSLPD